MFEGTPYSKSTGNGDSGAAQLGSELTDGAQQSSVAAQSVAPAAQKTEERQSGKGGKGDKGKGKAPKGQVDGRCAQKTPDGKAICYPYNTKGKGCSRDKCIFEHVCGICFKPGHGAYACPQGGRYQ